MLKLTLAFVFATIPAAISASELSVQALIDGCDRLASHPDDPHRTAPGLEREEMNLASAEKACEAARVAAPWHARTAYHLGRVLYYEKRAADALPHLELASAAGYPQAMFVLGYIGVTGDAPLKAWCRARDLWTRAVGQDHPWSAYHLIEKQLDGRFSGCSGRSAADDLSALRTIIQSRITLTASGGRVEALLDRVKTTK